jgi:tRNA 2-thiocytidine biosynthesis protein TtcA
MNNCCPMDGHSKREDMKELINGFSKEIPQIKANLLGAIKRKKIDGWKE